MSKYILTFAVSRGTIVEIQEVARVQGFGDT